ncbi:GNAT family N-acetyltransferase [Aspergillus lucknowensis]|uniref:N-acetyltransferase domain-containing protein n=1 Tax=Aspergillus lucknowensis TaxID=176173 RepID=A0ABR4M5X2_9EURO
MNRRAQLEALQSPRLRSPSSPIANIYLRPVEDKDVPELQTIYDWYARNSVCSPNTRDLDPEEVRQRIETCRSANLPFIVAIQRRSVTSKGPERILGYALAREFDSTHLACRNTAELELYVKDGHTNQGIGKCLLDKLLEVCDPTYVPKSGYQFEANIDDRGAYFPGGRRRLGRLVFTLCYIEDREIAEHKRVKKWLAEHAEFEEQGLLRGVRVKWNKL